MKFKLIKIRVIFNNFTIRIYWILIIRLYMIKRNDIDLCILSYSPRYGDSFDNYRYFEYDQLLG